MTGVKPFINSAFQNVDLLVDLVSRDFPARYKCSFSGLGLVIYCAALIVAATISGFLKDYCCNKLPLDRPRRRQFAQKHGALRCVSKEL